MQSHIRKVYACLAVTCHVHFRQNDRDLLRATAVLDVEYMFGVDYDVGYFEAALYLEKFFQAGMLREVSRLFTRGTQHVDLIMNLYEVSVTEKALQSILELMAWSSWNHHGHE